MKRVVVIAIASMLVAACGESSEDKKAAEKYRGAMQEYKTDVQDWKKDQIAYDECGGAMGDLRDAVKEVDGRLNVGLSYEDYAEKVGDASVVYNQTEFEAGGIECVTTVGVPLEVALGQYEKAYDVWQKCSEDFYCEQDSIDSSLQSHWGKATSQISRSDSALARLKVGPRPQPPKKPAAI